MSPPPEHLPERLLVTGGAGFIGANFVHHWLTRNPGGRLVVLDALTYAGNLDNLSSLIGRQELRFVHGNILDQGKVETLLREERIDTLVHFAAESHVDRSILGPDAFIETNINGTHSLLKAAQRVWLDTGLARHRFHHVSTDEVYGSLGAADAAFREDDPYRPNSPYAASKAASDHLVRAYHRSYGLNVTTSNCSNNYGPYQFPEKLIPLLINRCLSGGAIPVYGDGQQVRDWLHVDDHNRGIEAVIRRGISGRTYNIGGHGECSNMQLITLLCELLDDRLPDSPHRPHLSLVSHVADRPGHDRRYAIDPARIEDELGFQPSIDLNSGLAATVDWYLENRDWCRNAMDADYQDWVRKQYGGESAQAVPPTSTD